MTGLRDGDVMPVLLLATGIGPHDSSGKTSRSKTRYFPPKYTRVVLFFLIFKSFISKLTTGKLTERGSTHVTVATRSVLNLDLTCRGSNSRSFRSERRSNRHQVF